MVQQSVRIFLSAAFPGRDLPAGFRKEFERAVLVKSFSGGEFLAFEEDACEFMPLVARGSVRVYKSGQSGREITLYRIEEREGCVLTASCLLSERAFPAFAVVEGAGADLILVPAAAFRRWMHAHDFFRDYVFSIFAQRLAAVIETVSGVAFARVDARTAARLVNLRASSTGDVLDLTHQQLAADVGASREVVSRILKDFEHRGLVELSRHAVRIVDAEALRRVGGDAG